MFLGHVILKYHPGFRTTAWRNGCWDNTLLWTLSRVVFHFSPKFFYKMLTCAKLGATVNDEQSNPSDMPGGLAPSKPRKIILLTLCITPRRDRYAAAIVTPPLPILPNCWITAYTCAICLAYGYEHPNRVQVQQYRWKSFWIYLASTKHFSSNDLLIQPRAWPTLCRDSSGPCSLLLYMTQLIPKSK